MDYVNRITKSLSVLRRVGLRLEISNMKNTILHTRDALLLLANLKNCYTVMK